jgi:purine nucleosidase
MTTTAARHTCQVDRPGTVTQVLLDTDIGGDIDDAVCLAYLLREPRCELLGITTNCGQAEIRAAIADAICRAAGRDIPIVAGADRPLHPIPLYPTPTGAPALARWPHATYEPGDAAEFLYSRLAERPGEVTLVAIGAMTNVATLFARHPDAPGLLGGLAVMNGYFGAEPLPEPWWNWNSWVDATASRLVFGARVARHRAATLEVTRTLTVPAAEATAVLPATTELNRAVLDFGQAWLADTGRLTLHDPLAALTVFHPDLCDYERGVVTVDPEDGGTTFTPDPDGPVEITRAVDTTRFWRLLRDTGDGSCVPVCGGLPPQTGTARTVPGVPPVAVAEQ